MADPIETIAARTAPPVESKPETRNPPPAQPLQTPDAKPKIPAPTVYVLKSGKLTDDGRDELEKGITRCGETIGDGLRQFIENKIELGQAARGELENAFEAARTCLRKKPDLTDLEAAREGVDLVVVLLANHSVRDVLALNRAKATFAATAKTVALLTPK